MGVEGFEIEEVFEERAELIFSKPWRMAAEVLVMQAALGSRFVDFGSVPVPKLFPLERDLIPPTFNPSSDFS